MEPSKCIGLLMLLTATLAVGASTPWQDAEALRLWLADPDARQSLLDIWRKGRSPLDVAFAAYNASASEGRAGLPRAVSPSCALDVAKMLDSRALWAFSMLDASVKVPEGLLAQVFTHFGNWDECVNQRDIPSAIDSQIFHGQMCMVKLRPVLRSGASVMNYSLAPTAAHVPRDDPGMAVLLSYIQIALGMCVPSTCTAGDVKGIFALLFKNELKISNGIQLVVDVSDNDCSTRDKPSLDDSDLVAVVLLSVLAALVVISTIYDVVTPDDKRRPLPAAFSVVTNGRKLLTLPRADSDHTLSCLHGIRFLSMCWVVLGHRYLASLMAPSINPQFRNDIIGDFNYLFLTNATLSVDTFFVLSGLLLGYLFFKQERSKQRMNIPMYYLHRYIRLTPALAMVVLLHATLLIRVGWGPLWTDSLTGLREVCRTKWWQTLIYVGNYVEPMSQCVGQTWYLMVDMQLHWLSPLVILPLVKFPRAGFLGLIVLSIAGILWNILFFYFQDLPASPLTTFDDPEKTAYSQKYFYYPTHSRFVPYLIGLGTGYIIAIRQRSSQLKRLPFLFSAIGWLGAVGLMLASFLVFYIFFHPPYPPKIVGALYGSLSRPVWGLGVALIVYLCAIGNGGGANSFLSWWGFHVLGRLSYSVYLVHAAIQSITVGSKKTLIQLGDSSILEQFASDLLISLFFAMILSLVCESPFLVLEKELLGGTHKRKQTPLSTSVSQPHDATANVLSIGLPKSTDDESLKPLPETSTRSNGHYSEDVHGVSNQISEEVIDVVSKS